MVATHSAEAGQTMVVKLNDLMFKGESCHYGRERYIAFEGVRGGRCVVDAAAAPAAVTTNRSNRNNDGGVEPCGRGQRQDGERMEGEVGRYGEMEEGDQDEETEQREWSAERERKVMDLGKCLGNVPRAQAVADEKGNVRSFVTKRLSRGQDSSSVICPGVSVRI